MENKNVKELDNLLNAYNEQTPQNEDDKHSHVDYGDSYGDSCCC